MFLKRLRGVERPFILDLGHLSGSNIEFFAQRGCKIQIEDLLSAAQSGPPSEPGSRTVPKSPKEAPPPVTGAPRSVADAARRDPSTAATALKKPGARPSRRIVLPTRTFPKHELSLKTGRVGPRGYSTPSRGPGARRVWDTRLPTHLSFADETFDAILGWDVFNYYPQEPARLIAADVRRMLKPGGALLCYFDAKTIEDPVAARRYRIIDEKKIASDDLPGQLMFRTVYQNRDIEKMFAGLRIAELYFLKNSMREILLEKKSVTRTVARARPKPKVPKPRFTIE